jgi:hypothetical protein
MHRDWEHGEANPGQRPVPRSATGTGVLMSVGALYRANRDLDANDDGVACEA